MLPPRRLEPPISAWQHPGTALSFMKHLAEARHSRMMSNVRVERAARCACQALRALSFPRRAQRPPTKLSRTAPTHS
jgi:hypothetical protein